MSNGIMSATQMAQAMSITWREEVEKMFDEEMLLRSSPQYVRGGANYEECVETLRKAAISYLMKDVNGCLWEELLKRLEGAARALSISISLMSEILNGMIAEGELIAIQEESEWPPGSGWMTKLQRIRVSPETWVKAVS